MAVDSSTSASDGTGRSADEDEDEDEEDGGGDVEVLLPVNEEGISSGWSHGSSGSPAPTRPLRT